jgi:hypothetical protein
MAYGDAPAVESAPENYHRFERIYLRLQRRATSSTSQATVTVACGDFIGTSAICKWINLEIDIALASFTTAFIKV